MNFMVIFRLFILSSFCFFINTLFAVSEKTSLSQESSSGNVNSVPTVLKVEPINPDVKAPIFYSTMLSESIFLQGDSVVINAYFDVKVLQGDLDIIEFEMHGDGDILSLSGEEIKDWSIRRAGQKRSLEIRFKKTFSAGSNFSLTVSAHLPLKTPTTLDPLTFSNNSAVAFTGILRILSLAEYRLSPKHERGLVPLKASQKNELIYTMQNTMSSLLLDVIRSEELLEPVALENFLLVGDIKDGAAHFRLTAKAHVREKGIKIPILFGDAAFSNFPENPKFSVSVSTDEKSLLPTYSLSFLEQGKFDLDISFDVKITKKNTWNNIEFLLPAAKVAPFLLKGLSESTYFDQKQSPSPIYSDGSFQGFLPSNGQFSLLWKENNSSSMNFSSTIFSVDSFSEIDIFTGYLRIKDRFVYSILQGELSELKFKLYGQGDIVNLWGVEVRSWRVEENPDTKERVLTIALNTPKGDSYELFVLSQTKIDVSILSNKLQISPLRILPDLNTKSDLVCVKFNDFLKIQNNEGMRFEFPAKQKGIMQVSSDLFKVREISKDKKEKSSDDSYVYRISADKKEVDLTLSTIPPEISVNQKMDCFFDDARIAWFSKVDLKISEAPIYDFEMLIPIEMSILSVESEALASYDLLKDNDAGVQKLKMYFTNPQKDTVSINLSLQKDLQAGSPIVSLNPCKYPKARSVGGVLNCNSRNDIRLLPIETKGLVEKQVDIAIQQINDSNRFSHSFDIKQNDWHVDFRVEKLKPLTTAQVSMVYRLDKELISAEATVNYDTKGQALASVKFLIPQNSKVKKVTGNKVVNWIISEENPDLISVFFSSLQRDKFSIVVEFDINQSPEGNFDYLGIVLQDVAREEGKIYLLSKNLIGQKDQNGTLVLSLYNSSEEKIEGRDFFVIEPVQYLERPFSLKKEFYFMVEKDCPKQIVRDLKYFFNEKESVCLVKGLCHFYEQSSMTITIPENWVLKNGDNLGNLDAGGKNLQVIGSGNKKFSFSFKIPKNLKKEQEMELPLFSAPIVNTEVSFQGEYLRSSPNVNFEKIKDSRVWAASWNEVRFSNTVLICFISSLSMLILSLVPLRLVKKKNMRSLLKLVACAAGSTFIMCFIFALMNGTPIYPKYEPSLLYLNYLPASTEISFIYNSFDVPYLNIFESQNAVIACLACSIFLCFLSVLIGLGPGARIFARIILYFSCFLFGQNDLIAMSRAIFVIIVVVEIMLIFSRFLSGTGKPMKNKNKMMPLVVFILGLFFLPTIINNTVRNSLFAAEPEKTDVIIFKTDKIADKIIQTIEIQKDRAFSRGEITLSGNSGDRFDFLKPNATLIRFENKPDSWLRLERRVENGHFIYQAVLERTGTFTAEFAYEFLVEENDRFSLPSGIAAADVVNVKLTSSDMRCFAKSSVSIENKILDGVGEIAQIVFKPQDSRNIVFRLKERDRSKEELSLFVSSECLYQPSNGIVEGVHLLKVTPVRGEFDFISIKIPVGYSVPKIEGDNVSRWSYDRASNELKILFDVKKSTTQLIYIYTQSTLSDLPTEKEIAPLWVENAEEQIRTMGVLLPSSLQLNEIIEGDGFYKVDLEFVNSVLLEKMSKQNASVNRIYRTNKKDSVLKMKLSEQVPQINVFAEQKFVIESEKIILSADISMQILKAAAFKFSFDLPEGMDVETISGKSLSYWNVEKNGNLRRINVFAKGALLGESIFHIVLSGQFPEKHQNCLVPSIVVNEAENQSGKIVVSSSSGLSLDLKTRKNIVEINSENENLFFKNYVFRYFSPKWSLIYDVASFKAKMNATWVQKVSLYGKYVAVEVPVFVFIENAAKTSVEIDLPKNAVGMRVSGDAILSNEILKNGKYLVHFVKPMKGIVSFKIDYFLEASSKLKIQPIGINAEEINAWVAVFETPQFKGNLDSKLVVSNGSVKKDIPEEILNLIKGENVSIQKNFYLNNTQEKELSISLSIMPPLTSIPVSILQEYDEISFSEKSIIGKKHLQVIVSQNTVMNLSILPEVKDIEVVSVLIDDETVPYFFDKNQCFIAVNTSLKKNHHIVVEYIKQNKNITDEKTLLSMFPKKLVITYQENFDNEVQDMFFGSEEKIEFITPENISKDFPKEFISMPDKKTPPHLFLFIFVALIVYIGKLFWNIHKIKKNKIVY